MTSSSSLTNDEIKHRILNIYAQFVSDVEPDRLFDWLVQEHVITIDQKQRIRRENPIASDRCRALLDHLFSIQHPRAFLVVRRALSKENHYLLEDIDSVDGIPVQPEEQPVLQGKNTIQQLEKDSENQKRAWEEEKDRLLKIVKEHDDQRRAWEEEKGPLLKIQNEYDDQKRAGEAEKDRLLKMQEEHENQKRAWEEENDRLLKIETEDEDQKRSWETEQDRLLKMQEELEANLHLDKIPIQQLENDNVDKNDEWEAEKDRLLKMPKELEAKPQLGVSEQQQLEPESKVSSIYAGKIQNAYKSDPVLLQTITAQAPRKGKEIDGLAILDKELFVVCRGDSEVEVYDSIKFKYSRCWNLQGLSDPRDIGSCNISKCLYIYDIKGSHESSQILRVDPYGKLIMKWSTRNDFNRLSVTNESNVILTVYNTNKLNEYSPDGQLIREINLSSDPGIRGPLHAIKLTNGNFVVSLGYLYGDDRHRVWLVDENGKLKKPFIGDCVSSIGEKDFPLHLSVDGNGFVLVADRHNSRVFLLDSDLEFKGEILSKEKHKLQSPSRILLDESNRRLIVADNNVMQGGGRILIFEV